MSRKREIVALGKDGAIGEVISRRECNPVTGEISVRQRIVPINLYPLEQVSRGLAEVKEQLKAK